MGAPDYDKISRYVDGEMNAEELQVFEQAMQQDSELKKEVELYIEVQETLKMKLVPDEEEQALKNSLEQMQKDYFQSRGKIINMKRYRWWAASAAAVFIAIMLWAPWKTNLYRQYAAIEMAPVEVRGTTSDSLIQKATENFNVGQYADAIPTFESLLRLDPGNAYIRFYYAISLLETKNIEKSRKELSLLYEGNSVFRYDAAFYIALSYLKEKNKSGCIEWLNKIPSDASIYGKAQALLRKLH